MAIHKASHNDTRVGCLLDILAEFHREFLAGTFGEFDVASLPEFQTDNRGDSLKDIQLEFLSGT